MREAKEKKIVGISFSIGCISPSSVAVSRSQTDPTNLSLKEGGKSMKIPTLQRLIKSFKDLSQKLAFRDDEEEEDGEMEEMVIGFPTDVQHVGHIGWDGTSSSLTTLKSGSGGGGGGSSSSSRFSLPCVYLKQFELAMAAHAAAASRPDSSHSPLDFGEFPNAKFCN